MRAAKVLSEVVRATRRHHINRYARCIRRDERSRFAVFFNFLKNLLLNVKAFDNNLNNPIGIGDFRHIIVEIAERYARCKSLIEQRRGFRFQSRIISRLYDAVSLARILFLVVGEVKRYDVEHQNV